MKNKDWLTLTSHGKEVLHAYACAISANDMTTSQMDYLNAKGLIDYCSKFPDYKKRNRIGIECLTDLGLATINHYFKNYI